MTTNKQIDDLIARLNAYDPKVYIRPSKTNQDAIEALRSQQKRIQELESDLKQTREIVMQEAKLANEAEAKLSAIRQAVEKVSLVGGQGGFYELCTKQWQAILDTVKDAPCNCSVETRTVCDKCQRPASPTMQAELDAAVMRGFEDAPAQQPDSTSAQVPEGWCFYSADFSLQSAGKSTLGSVTLIRDANGRKEWHELPEEVKEGDNCPLLYVSGKGETIIEAIEYASAIAMLNQSQEG